MNSKNILTTAETTQKTALTRRKIVGRHQAGDAEIPPEGIGKGIRHVSYSDLGGRPDSVQVMFNRQHVYVGHKIGRASCRERV